MTIFKLYLNNSKSYWLILMGHGIMVQNAERKAESKNEKNWSKVKVTDQGQRGQITVKKDSFQAVTSITQKVIDWFYWAMAVWCRML